MINYPDLVEIPVEDARARIRTWLGRLPIPVTLWAEGGAGEAIVEVGAGIWHEVSKMSVALKTFAVGELATGQALDIYSRNQYGHTRNPGTRAVYQVILACESGNGPYTLNKGNVIIGDGDNSYYLTEVIGQTFPYQLQPNTAAGCRFECGIIGDQANVATGEINQMVTTYVGVTCTNIALLVAGANIESDESLQTRNSLKWATRNPLSLVADAYDYYARMASPNVARVAVLGTGAYGLATVHVVIAASDGTSGTEDVNAVYADLQGRVLPGLVTVTVAKAGMIPINPNGTIYYLSGFSVVDVQAKVTLAVKAKLGQCPIGGRNLDGMGANVLPVSDISDAIENTLIGDQRCVVGHALAFAQSYVALSRTDIPILGSLSGITWVPVTP